MREVFGQPTQLFGRNALLVVARCGAVITIAINVVEHHIMYLADIKGIIHRSDKVDVFALSIKVVDGFVVIVVVADGMEYLQVLHQGVDGVQVFGYGKKIGIPIQVPCHVTQRNGIHFLSWVGSAIIIEVGCEGTELAQVVGAVGKVHVAQHQDLVCILSRHLR